MSELLHVAEPVREADTFGLLGSSTWLDSLLAQVRRAARCDLPVLIVGETGTGKELVAQALHRCSGRIGNLVALDAGVVAADLVEAELFGSVRGAFTGAVDRPGLIEQAHRGTLFLDEACGLPLAIQAKLLRVLETRRVRRVGGHEERHAEFRLVLALQEPAEALVQAGRWREDFRHRVNAIALRLPPLRERLEDVPLLINHALDVRGRPALPADDIASALAEHHWPGNVRELIRVVERADFHAGDGPLGASALRTAAGLSGDLAQVPGRSLSHELDLAARRTIAHALVAARYNRAEAAAELGLSVDQLYRRMKMLGLRVRREL